MDQFENYNKINDIWVIKIILHIQIDLKNAYLGKSLRNIMPNLIFFSISGGQIETKVIKYQKIKLPHENMDKNQH